MWQLGVGDTRYANPGGKSNEPLASAVVAHQLEVEGTILVLSTYSKPSSVRISAVCHSFSLRKQHRHTIWQVGWCNPIGIKPHLQGFLQFCKLMLVKGVNFVAGWWCCLVLEVYTVFIELWVFTMNGEHWLQKNQRKSLLQFL